MIKSLIGRVSAKQAAREMNRILKHLRVGVEDELALCLVGAFVARRMLLDSKHIDGVFPSTYLNSQVPVTKDASLKLSLYTLQLIKLHKQTTSLPNDHGQMIGFGLSIWICSIRGLTMPTCFPIARSIWTELLRGKPLWFSTAQAVLNPLVLGDYGSDFYFVPAYLAPNDDGPLGSVH